MMRDIDQEQEHAMDDWIVPVLAGFALVCIFVLFRVKGGT
jgi:hypothetical protein